MWEESVDEFGQTRSYKLSVDADCQRYINWCGDISDDAVKANLRGLQWYMVIGTDRQNKLVSGLNGVHQFLLTRQ